MAIQASFAKKLTWSQDCNHRLLALLGNDSELDLALLDVKNRVRDLPLWENNLILVEFGYRFPSPTLARNVLGSNLGLRLTTDCPFFRNKSSFPPPNTVRRRAIIANSTAEMKIWLIITSGMYSGVARGRYPRIALRAVAVKLLSPFHCVALATVLRGQLGPL
jgi:hypothetical protein